MRQILTITILILFISCQSKTDSDLNLGNYNQGIKVLESLDSNGEIDYAKALSFFDNSLQENPNHVESCYWKMQCEMKLKNLGDVLETSKFVINNPKMSNHKLIPSFYVSAGVVEKIKGNNTESTNFFSTAMKIYNERVNKNINDTDAIMNKATIMCYINKKDEAIKFLDSISLNENSQIIIDQIRKNILDFDSEKIFNELKGDKY